jgi:hypothetical protein
MVFQIAIQRRPYVRQLRARPLSLLLKTFLVDPVFSSLAGLGRTEL